MTRPDEQGSGGNGDALLTAPAMDFHGLAGSAAHSRLVQRLCRRYPDELPLLAPGVPTRSQ